MLLQLYHFHNRKNPNLFLEKVRDTTFPEGYVLPTFVVYKGYKDLEKHLRRFKRQSNITVNQCSYLSNFSYPSKDCFQLVLFMVGNNNINLEKNGG